MPASTKVAMKMVSVSNITTGVQPSRTRSLKLVLIPAAAIANTKHHLDKSLARPIIFLSNVLKLDSATNNKKNSKNNGMAVLLLGRFTFF